MHICDKNPNFDSEPESLKKICQDCHSIAEILKCLFLQLIVDYFEKDFEEGTHMHVRDKKNYLRFVAQILNQSVRIVTPVNVGIRVFSRCPTP